MLMFGLYAGERITLDVGVGATVREVREMIMRQLNITVDQYKTDKKVLVLSWAGSDLQDPWVFSDLGIVPGSTIRVNLKEEVKPVLFIYCSHSQDTINLYDNLVIGHMELEELRTVASLKTGLPVGIFRLVNQQGTEMYDGNRLEDYGVDVGHTISLENLNGWNEFINLAVMGFTPQVVSQISQDENTGRYQMKVALFLAAHFGHIDLARAMLRMGMKASEPIGYPPQRMWCTEDGHIESRKAAVHHATEMGQLGVLRLFVNHDITVITAKDGNDLAPLNIALRKKVKNCASFLLTKQWSKVNVTKYFSLQLGTYTHLRQWCDRAKERCFVKYGQSKSSLKRRPAQTGPLVGFGVSVDGFSQSIMTGKSKAQLQREKERDRRRQAGRPSVTQMSVAEIAGSTADPESYFKQVNAVQSLKAMGGPVKGKFGKTARVASKANLAVDALTARSQVSTTDVSRSQRSPEPSEETARLPPIMQRLRQRLVSTSQGSVSSDVKEAAPPPAPAPAPAPTQPPVLLSSPPEGEGGEGGGGGGDAEAEKGTAGGGGSMMSKLIKSRGNAFFMAGGAGDGTNAPRAPAGQPPPEGGTMVPSLVLPNTERNEKPGGGEGGKNTTATTTTKRATRRRTESIDTSSTVSEGLQPHPPAPGLTSTSTTNNNTNNNSLMTSYRTNQNLTRRDTLLPTGRTDAPSRLPPITDRGDGGGSGGDAGNVANASATSRKKGKKNKRRGTIGVGGGRVTSALLLSKARASEGSIPLPLISTEQDRRPFFYYNGKRNDDMVDPTMTSWSQHTQGSAGATPRERAIKSLSVANTFKDKPWLGQVRIALRIAANPTKRNVRRLRSATKRTFAIL